MVVPVGDLRHSGVLVVPQLLQINQPEHAISIAQVRDEMEDKSMTTVKHMRWLKPANTHLTCKFVRG